MTQFELFLLFVLLLLLGLAATRLRVLRVPFKRAARWIKEFEEEDDISRYKYEARPYLWYIAGVRTSVSGGAPEMSWIDHALDADYRMNPLWQNPTILAYYAGRDLRTVPDWEPASRGFMEVAWWVAVVVFSVLVFGGLVWGLMNRAGA